MYSRVDTRVLSILPLNYSIKLISIKWTIKEVIIITTLRLRKTLQMTYINLRLFSCLSNLEIVVRFIKFNIFYR